MQQRSPLIALLTDFGHEDHYVGTIKGILHSRIPHLRIVDITHAIEPFAIQQAAYTLWASYKFFPVNTTFCCIVDPGVGSERNIGVLSSMKYYFIAPDNGLLDIVASDSEKVEYTIVDIDRCRKLKIIPPALSNTFHGRDVLAPLAASIAQGTSPRRYGQIIPYSVKPIFFKKHRAEPGILSIDRFGTIITNIESIHQSETRQWMKGLKIRRRSVTSWITHYQEARVHQLSLITGSSGLVEIVIKNANAATMLNADLHTTISVIPV